ncbi:GrpE-domain-containing protein [Myxozyma melibiosi]|uniref:GrpE protein homolog n=1 Tax=Myxozyma melibiosi TaxID=54550 RepID=A0ABR1F9P5_9ASCO
MLRTIPGRTLGRAAVSARQVRMMNSSSMLKKTTSAHATTMKIMGGSAQQVGLNVLSGRRMYATATDKTEKETEEKSEEKKTEGGEEEEVTGDAKKIAELETQLATKAKEAAELKDRLLRQVADFRNLQETTKREVQNAKEFAISKFARDLLDSVDNLDRALATVPEPAKNQSGEAAKEEEVTDKVLISLFDGVKMTQQVLEQTLKRHGLTKIDPLGEKFDPHKHEATFEVAQPDKEPGTVFFVQQAGFMLNNRVLRAAKVGVVKAT